MKKVVERMDGAVRRAQAQAASRTDARDEETGKKEREKKGRWGLPLPSLSGGSGAKKEKGAAGSERQDAGQNAVDAVEGLRVDQYLVVFLKFMSSIGERWIVRSGSAFRANAADVDVQFPRSRWTPQILLSVAFVGEQADQEKS